MAKAAIARYLHHLIDIFDLRESDQRLAVRCGTHGPSGVGPGAEGASQRARSLGIQVEGIQAGSAGMVLGGAVDSEKGDLFPARNHRDPAVRPMSRQKMQAAILRVPNPARSGATEDLPGSPKRPRSSCRR